MIAKGLVLIGSCLPQVLTQSAAGAVEGDLAQEAYGIRYKNHTST